MSHRDAVHYSAVAPNPSTEFVRQIWFVEGANDVYLWSPAVDQYVLYTPDVVVPPQPAATLTAAGIVELATDAEVAAGTDTDRAVTPSGLQSKVNALIDAAPTNLNTLGKLADALGDDATFSATVAAALATKANADGTNVSTPALSDADNSLVNTGHLQAVVEDTAVSNTNVDDARSQLTVLGATNSAAKQRFVTLPALDRFVSLVERLFAGAPGGSSSSLAAEDDVVLLDGTAGVPTLNVGNPALFKKKAYRVISVSSANTPVVELNGLYPAVNGTTTFNLALGQTLTLIPTSLGKWVAIVS